MEPFGQSRPLNAVTPSPFTYQCEPMPSIAVLACQPAKHTVPRSFVQMQCCSGTKRRSSRSGCSSSAHTSGGMRRPGFCAMTTNECKAPPKYSLTLGRMPAVGPSRSDAPTRVTARRHPRIPVRLATGVHINASDTVRSAARGTPEYSDVRYLSADSAMRNMHTRTAEALTRSVASCERCTEAWKSCRPHRRADRRTHYDRLRP